MKVAYLPQVKRKKNIILIILALALPLLVFAVYQVVEWRSRASGNQAPKNVVVSSITRSQFVISWTTDDKANGSVVLLDDGERGKVYVDQRGSSKRYYTHRVELSDLSPNTVYKFLIKSENKEYASSEGKELVFKTPAHTPIPTPKLAYGKIDTTSKNDVLVYILLSDKSSYPVSTVLSSTNEWTVDLFPLLKILGMERIEVGDDTKLTVLATDGRGRGGVLEGSFSTLFHSTGALKETYVLGLDEGKDIYPYIPAEAKLAIGYPPADGTCWYFDRGVCKETTNCSVPKRYLTKELCESANLDDPYDPDPRDPDPYDPDPRDPNDPYDPDSRDPNDPDNPDYPPDYEFTNRQYRIIYSLRWTDLVPTSQSEGGVSTGAKSVRVVDISDTGFTVLWRTREKEEGYLKYGTSLGGLNNVASDRRDGELVRGEHYLHIVEVSKLQPETKYYFNVVSGKETYTNDGAGFTATTFKTIDKAGNFFSLIGELTGMPEHKEVILISHIKDGDNKGTKGTSTSVSSLVNEDGSWGITISNMRTEDGSDYFKHTVGDDLIIEPYTTFSSAQEKISMDGIDLKDIVIGLEEGDSPKSIKKVLAPRLQNYGITGSAQPLAPTSGSPESSGNSDTYSGETPNTGVLDSFWGVLLISVSLLGGGVVLYFSLRKKDKKSAKMKSSL